MIPNEIVYYKPETVEEAAEAWARADREGLDPLYLSGGTEIASYARKGLIKTGALVDLKGIDGMDKLRVEDFDTHHDPYSGERGQNGDKSGLHNGEKILHIGANVTLNRIFDSGLFPLLGKACYGVADRTVRNRITIGGNISGRLPYKEAVLPLLISDARLRLYGQNGVRMIPIEELFDKRLKMEKGEFLHSIELNSRWTSAFYYYGRRTRGPNVDYPLVTLCVLKAGDETRIAATGLFPYALRLAEVEKSLAGSISKSASRAASEALAALENAGYSFRSDERSGGAYRRRLLALEIEYAINYPGWKNGVLERGGEQ